MIETSRESPRGIRALIQNNDWPDDRPFEVALRLPPSPRQDEHYAPCEQEQHWAFLPANWSVVIDTDMAADGWLAILYLLGRPEVTGWA